MRRKNEIPRYENISALMASGFGYTDDIFFSAGGGDWSKIIILLNGANTKISIEPIFQRWSWHHRFRHPVFCIADPLTYGSNQIPIGWYLSDDTYLKDRLHTIKNNIPKKNKIVFFGSSAGGFASLLAAQTGLADISIAINPQTDILQFNQKRALEKFLSTQTNRGLSINTWNYNLSQLGFDLIKPDCKIVYIQNASDEHHFHEHMKPFLYKAIGDGLNNLSLHIFNMPDLRHDPPGIDDLISLNIYDVNQLFIDNRDN